MTTPLLQPDFPTWEEVRTTLTRHITHWAPQGGESALVLLRAEDSVSLQYAGRVVYELFQNALDRASSRVVVRFVDGLLVVGNNGRGVSVDPKFNYGAHNTGARRADFHALCALHTSNKDPDEQFGNKGIGFRSVFGVSDRVQVWSRCKVGWWGMELVERFVPTTWKDSAIPELDSAVRALGTTPRPSFQLPRPLRSSSPPHPAADGMSTVVLLQVDKDQARDQIAAEVHRLAQTRFQFVGSRRPGLQLELIEETRASTHGWGVVAAGAWPELAGLAEKAKHAVKRPTVQVAWAGPDEPRGAGWFYNYLPTRMSTGLPIDVHGDFQVKADRETMGLDGLNHVGRYNRALLAHAADLHVAALTEALQAPKPRPDFWELAACPRGDVPPAWREFLRDALFPGGSLDVWVEFAAQFFTNPHPRNTYERFWQESKRWLDGVARYSRQSQAWRKAARKLCDALAEQAVPVLPVQTADGLRPVALPTRQKRGDRAARRVFFWPESRDDAPPAVPRALLVRGRSVTTFPLGDCEDASGVARYDATQVLLDLRQIPNDPTSQDTGTSLTETQQGELLRLAAELRPSNEVVHFAWRAFEASEPTQRMGRAVATMYLPTIDGTWEPARQLSSDRVDSTRLAALAGEAAATQAFLRWLGVAPNGGVPLLERGDDGVLPPCSLPPDLQAPGTDRDLTLRPRMQPAPSLAAVAASIERLPDDLDRRSAVLHSLGTTAWLSRPLFLPQSDLPALPEHVAPSAVVLTPPSRDNRTVFFAVPKDEGHAPLLRRLGALDRPDSRESAHRTPDTLRWLRQRCPSPQLLSASLARRLAGLCDSLLDLLPHEGEDAVPVLLETGGGFRWRFDSEPAWLSTARERQEIRRFFPHVPLVVGTGGARLAERLNVGVVRLHSEVRGEPIGAPESRASRLVDRIRPLLPVLCAVAELSRQVQVDPGRILRCWWSGQPLLHVDDAWVLVRLTGPDEEPYRWRVGALDDVFYVGGPDKDEAQPIHFDCRGSGTPPLRHFGRALARQLVRNAALGPAFAEALSAAEDGGVDEFIERAHLRDLVLAWTARLRPLSKDDQDRLVAHLGRWSTDPKGVLSRGRLGSADLRPTLDVATASELSEGLHAVEGAGLAEHLPRVVVPAENEETWVEWMRRWRGTLLAWTAHQGIEAKDLEGELERGNPTEFDRLDFDPLRRACAALAFLGVDCDDLYSALDGFRPRFQAVAAAPISLEEAGWRPFEGMVAGGTGGAERKLTTQDILDEQAARTAWGDAAERALLTWVVERTRPLLVRADAKEALLSAFRPTSRTRAQVAAAIDAGDVEAALHIAQHWSGAGFDILGLEQQGGSLQPVRYECKGLPRDARRIRVHLSRRELAVARQPTGGGRWMLVGVQPDGAPVDLTALVEPLLADDPRPLAPLHAMGMEPDGYRLLVERAEG